MAQYDTLNIKLSKAQLNKSKSRIKNGTQVTLNLFYLLMNSLIKNI